jgi:hypothetical protein
MYCPNLSAEWITALATAAACLVALAIALFGRQMEQWFYRPDLRLEAVVKRPESEKVARWYLAGGSMHVPMGEAWFFRLAITNRADAPAREVQVFLKRIEKLDGTTVDRFSPMNLKWTHTGETTRKVLLRGVSVFCDFIHVGEPASRQKSGEDLGAVPSDKGVMCLDVEATNTGMGHLLEPGAYRFYLLLAAENFRAKPYAIEVRYDGMWSPHQDQMFDQEIGFRMRKVEAPR